MGSGLKSYILSMKSHYNGRFLETIILFVAAFLAVLFPVMINAEMRMQYSCEYGYKTISRIERMKGPEQSEALGTTTPCFILESQWD